MGMNLPVGSKVPVQLQVLAGALLTATEVPTYLTVAIEDRDKAARLLELLAEKAPLQKGNFLTLATSLDAYRLPEYKKHTPYVVSFRLYALKARLHLAVVGNQLVAATKAHVLREVIDSAATAPAAAGPKAHLLLRLSPRALERLRENVELTWSEKARLACHRNTISIYNLVKLYEVPLAEVPRLAEAKTGVRFFCPEGGTYAYDAARDRVVCSVHGNRQDARQHPEPGRASSFARFLEGLEEVVLRVRFDGDAVHLTVDVARPQPAAK
jgi:hypothetical protein